MAVEIAGEKRGTWFDHENNAGGGVLDLVQRERRLSIREALEWLRAEFGVEIGTSASTEPYGLGRIVAEYDYRNAGGQLLFQVVRFEPKKFLQRRPDVKGGWIWKLTGIPRVPYRLPQLLKSASEPEKPVFIVEGEKDVLALEALGLVATCNPGGAGKEPKPRKPYKSKWTASFAPFFAKRDVIILPDADEVGRCHAEAIARSLAGSASKIRVVNLPGLPPKGDVSDWLQAGGTRSELEKLAAETAEYGLLGEPDCPPRADREQLWLGIGSDTEIADRVTADLQERFGRIVFCGQFWYYRGTQWEVIPDETLWLTASRYDGAFFKTVNGNLSCVKLNKARLESILACMRPGLMCRDFFDHVAVGINCASGFIRFDDTGDARLEAHSPDHRCRHTLPGRWPKAFAEEERRTLLLERLLDGCFKDDGDKREKADLLAEIAGIAALGLATKIIRPKALVLKGELAENGKSQVLDVLRSLLPRSAISAISPARFDDRTFICHLDGKLLNAPDELAGGDAIASEVFKQIITGEPLTVRDVYKSAFEFRPVAQHVYGTNNLPTFRGGMDRGVRRRLMILTFNRVIPVEERIDHIGLKIGEQEANLLLDWAVQGASRVIARQAFAEPPSSAEALRDWMLSSDPVLSWLESEAVLCPSNASLCEVKTSTAYGHFRRWAIDEGHSQDKLPAINGFSQRVLAGAAEKGVRKKRTSKGSVFIKLKCIDVGISYCGNRLR